MLDVRELGSVTLFKDLPNSELKALGRELREVRHPAGHELMIRGQGGVGFMVIIDGTVEVEVPGGHRRALGPGDHFGEVALLDDGMRSAGVRTVSDVRLGAVMEWEFKGFLRKHPDIAYRIMRTLSQRLRDAEAR